VQDIIKGHYKGSLDGRLMKQALYVWDPVEKWFAMRDQDIYTTVKVRVTITVGWDRLFHRSCGVRSWHCSLGARGLHGMTNHSPLLDRFLTIDTLLHNTSV
jgi:hypothetical protein